MNLFDIIVLVMLIYALWRGWSQGFVLQICSMVGLLLSLWVAARLGHAVGQTLGVEPPATTAAGFAVVLVLCLIAIAIVGRMAKGLLQWIGLGSLDTLAGIVVAVVKYMLILSLLFSAFATLNEQAQLVEKQTIENSKYFEPVRRLSDTLLPFVTQYTQGFTAEE